ncbi:MAG TPA: GGDEF domain-containing protein [Burkholderiales bacterium]|nr:GGDEF domain-containing protein [Burkholderiales bacterium]
MQLDLRTLFIVLAILYACLGFVCLFLPYRTPGSHAVTNWGYGLLALAAGTAGLALRGAVNDFVTVDLANALILVSFVFILRSVRRGPESESNAFGWGVIGVVALLLWYFTYWQPDTRVRIVISSAAMTLLLVQPIAELIAAVPKGGRRAPIFTAACLVGVGVVTLARAVWTINWGEAADLLAPDFFQFSSIMLFAVFVVLATLGVVWIEIEQLQADLARLAMIDSLTAILNRRAFMLEYERELSRCVRENTGLALAIFDLDHFKEVNDTHGHLVGDQVLRQVADTLRASLRGHDVLGRYGGEEFALLMPGADMPAAIAATERARLAVGERPIQAGALSIVVTVSAGVAAYGDDCSDWESLLRSADTALYEAKRLGRNRVVAAHGPPPAREQAAMPTRVG